MNTAFSIEKCRCFINEQKSPYWKNALQKF